ncbi:MAG: hypothetical protein R3C55_13380 [Parvularculaceae bacterium]
MVDRNTPFLSSMSGMSPRSPEEISSVWHLLPRMLLGKRNCLPTVHEAVALEDRVRVSVPIRYRLPARLKGIRLYSYHGFCHMAALRERSVTQGMP